MVVVVDLLLVGAAAVIPVLVLAAAAGDLVYANGVFSIAGTDRLVLANHIAIRDLMAEQGRRLSDLAAVAVVHGPGSYTGLRVGMSAAKGLCYALDLPLITVNTLEWMAEAAKGGPEDMICPMIDARRNEVFTALYDRNGSERLGPHALILDDSSFAAELELGTIRSMVSYGDWANGELIRCV